MKLLVGSISLFFVLVTAISCDGSFKNGGKIELHLKDSGASIDGGSSSTISLSTASVVNNQLVVNGSNLAGVTSIRMTGPSGFDETFSIESQSASTIVANGLRNISIALGGIFSLIITDAYGAATYDVTFTLQDGAVTASKLSDMGAGVGQVLKYNGTAWVPSDLGALTYAGNWDANANSPDLSSGGSNGEYYIVSTAGSTDLLGGSGTNSWGVGDWVVWNNVSARWEKVDNATNVQSFNGRSGAVTPQSGDYAWAQINKTTSSIGDIADVDTTGIAAGKVLKWDGSAWVISDDLSGGGAGSVSTSEIADGTIVDADVSGSAAISQSKISNLTSDLSSKLPLTGGSMTGDITMGANNITFTTGLVDGVDVSALSSSVSTNTVSIAGKEDSISAGTTAQYWRGDKTWQTLDTDVVPEGASNKYYTTAQARTDLVEVGSITNGQTTTAPSSDDVFDALALKQNSLGYTPVNKAGDSMSGNLSMGAQSEVRFQDSDSSNYVALKAPATIASDLTFILPNADGSNGQVLSTDGSGNLTWATPASGTGDITDVVAGTGLTGGATSGSATLNVDIGTTANKIVQLDGTGKLPAIDGSQLTNLPNPTASTVLSGFVTGADSTVLNTDTIEEAIEKIQGQIDGNNTDIANLNTDAVPEGASNKYYTAAQARTDLLEVGSITNGQTTTAPSSDDVFDALALKQNGITGSDNLSVNSVTTSGQNGVNLAPFGTSAGQLGELRFYELTANGPEYVGFKGKDSLSASIIWILPDADGSNGQVLSTNGSGVLSWANATSGSVTNVTATLPLASSGGATPNISMTQSNTTTDGYLSSTDWNTFNNKVSKAGDSMTGALSMNAQNEVRFKDSDSSNYVSLRSPASVTTDITFTLPSADGSNGQVLSTDGAGNLTWASPGTGDITDVVAGTGLTGGATSGSATLNVDVGTTANKIVQLDASARLPAVDGSLLTNLPNPTTSTVLTGFVTGADSTVANTDTIEEAIEKIQGQINGNNTDIIARLPLAGGTMSGAIDMGSNAISNISQVGGNLMGTGQMYSSQSTVATGAAVDFDDGNVQVLESVGGTAITLSNMQDGAAYTVVISDTTSRTYTFNGCTNSHFKPDNAATDASKHTIYNILKVTIGGATHCYISWSSGF